MQRRRSEASRPAPEVASGTRRHSSAQQATQRRSLQAEPKETASPQESASPPEKRAASPDAQNTGQAAAKNLSRRRSAGNLEGGNAEAKGASNQRRLSAPNLSGGRADRREEIKEKAQEEEAKKRTRKLSFVDCSLQQVEDAILSVGERGYSYNTLFWDTILSGAPSNNFKALQNRTLTFWVKVFNKWLDYKTTDVNGVQLQEMMFISKQSLGQIVELYDSDGARRLRIGGPTHANLAMVKIPAIELMIAGVMLSRLISTRNKISFVFGLVDSDCSRSLSRRQFATFIRCFMCGLGGAFGVAVENMPKPDHIGMVVDLLYTRINAAASSRVKEILSHGDNQVRTAVVQAIKARQKGVESSVVNCGEKFLSKVEGHLLSYSVLREWCCAELLDQDPLSLPFRLAIMRFCPLRQGDFADEYCDDLKEFQLSHDERVIIPEDKSEVDPKDMLNRAEVAYIHEVLNYCHHHFKVSLTGEEMNHIALQLGMQIGRPVKLKLMSVLEVYAREVDDQRLRGIGGKVSSGGLNSINLINVLRRMCPSAQPKHLRMCEVWVSEYENLASVRTSVEDLEQAAALYLLNDQKPFLPQNELEILNREFDQLDAHRRGYITLDDIAFGWNWTTDVAQATLASYDLTGDGYIDRNEFLRMMCPSDYRLPEMAGVTRQMFGKVLTTTAEQQRRCLDNSEVRFTDASTEEGVLRLEAPRAVLPVVSTEDWAQWNHVFDSIDRNSDGKVHKRELMSSGLLSASACDAITALIDPEDKSCFTKRAFLDAMLKAHDCREPNSA